MKKPWVLVVATVLTTVSTLAFVRAQGEEAPSPPPQATVQPIAFPHNTHAGEFQIDCQYCHFSAERSVSAGIPPVAGTIRRR